MGRKSSWGAEELAFLETRVEQYLDIAKSKLKLYEPFWTTIRREFNEKFPFIKGIFPGRSAETLNAEELVQLDKHRETTINRICSFYRWRATKAKKKLAEGPKLDKKMKRNSKRIYKAVEVYSKMYFKSCLKKHYKREKKRLGFTNRQALGLKTSIAREYFAKEDAETIAKVTERMERENNRLLGISNGDPTPADYQQAIDDIPACLLDILKPMLKASGYTFAVLMGGLSPLKGGKIVTSVFHLRAPGVSLTFSESNSNFEDGCAKPFAKYLKSEIDPAVCASRALTEEDAEDLEEATQWIDDDDSEEDSESSGSSDSEDEDIPETTPQDLIDDAHQNMLKLNPKFLKESDLPLPADSPAAPPTPLPTTVPESTSPSLAIPPPKPRPLPKVKKTSARQIVTSVIAEKQLSGNTSTVPNESTVPHSVSTPNSPRSIPDAAPQPNLPLSIPGSASEISTSHLQLPIATHNDGLSSNQALLQGAGLDVNAPAVAKISPLTPSRAANCQFGSVLPYNSQSFSYPGKPHTNSSNTTSHLSISAPVPIYLNFNGLPDDTFKTPPRVAASHTPQNPATNESYPYMGGLSPPNGLGGMDLSPGSWTFPDSSGGVNTYPCWDSLQNNTGLGEIPLANAALEPPVSPFPPQPPHVLSHPQAQTQINSPQPLNNTSPSQTSGQIIAAPQPLPPRTPSPPEIQPQINAAPQLPSDPSPSEVITAPQQPPPLIPSPPEIQPQINAAPQLPSDPSPSEVITAPQQPPPHAPALPQIQPQINPSPPQDQAQINATSQPPNDATVSENLLSTSPTTVLPTEDRSKRQKKLSTCHERMDMIGSTPPPPPRPASPDPLSVSEWATITKDHMLCQSLQTPWAELVVAWFELEEELGFGSLPGVKAGLPASLRPSEWIKWTSRSKSGAGRDLNCPPSIQDPADLGLAIVAWWNALQPSFRQSKSGPPLPVLNSLPDDQSEWLSLCRAGPNGFVSIILLLQWWGLALPLRSRFQEDSTPVWVEVTTDVLNVLRILKNCAGNLVNAKKRKRSTGEATSSKKARTTGTQVSDGN